MDTAAQAHFAHFSAHSPIMDNGYSGSCTLVSIALPNSGRSGSCALLSIAHSPTMGNGRSGPCVLCICYALSNYGCSGPCMCNLYCVSTEDGRCLHATMAALDSSSFSFRCNTPTVV
jgi:hypothetical protein